MSRLFILVILAVFTVLVISACGTPSTPVQQQAPPASELTKKPEAQIQSQGWEMEWERVLAAARREGKVVVYSSEGTQTRNFVVQSFKEKWGIEVDFIASKGAELSARLLAERRAGLYLPDVYFAGATTIVNDLKPAGILDPIEPALLLPEVTNPKAWFGEKFLWIDPDKLILGFVAMPYPPFAINTELVKPGDLKSWRDLLQPQWKGKIILNDPTAAGASLKTFGVESLPERLGVDYWRQLARQEPVVLRDQRLQIDWLAHGKYSIVISPKSDPLSEFIKAGAPLKGITPQEGTYLMGASGNISLLNRSPHPNAAKLFINWLLSREAQTLYSQTVFVQSARVDVPTDHLDPIRVRQPGVKYFWSDTEEFLSRQPEQAKLAKEIFGSLVR